MVRKNQEFGLIFNEKEDALKMIFMNVSSQILIIKINFMNQNTKDGPFGFYCPQSKMFYSVLNEEVYNELMALMRQGAFSKENTEAQSCGQINQEVDLNQHYVRMMDQDIEEIYKDPIFTREIQDLQLKEYDF